MYIKFCFFSVAVSAATLTSAEATVSSLGMRFVCDHLVEDLLHVVSDDGGTNVLAASALGHGLGLVLLHLAHAFGGRAHELLVVVVLVVGSGTAAGHGHETLTLLSGSRLIY